jgi:hypothetical protein
VTAFASAFADRHLRPGQGLELSEQGWLVAFGRDQQVSAAGGDLLRVVALRVQGIGDEQHPVQGSQLGSHLVQQRRERGVE